MISPDRPSTLSVRLVSLSLPFFDVDVDRPPSALLFTFAVAMKPEFDFKAHKEADLLKELTLQVRKVSNKSVFRCLFPLNAF